MKTLSSPSKRGFTLLETVIAIGVLAVLLTGFMVVFAPAAEGIRKSIDVQQADRLTSTLEQELVTLRTGQSTALITTGFDKSFDWIQSSNTAANALVVYQYRGKTDKLRTDGTPEPEPSVKENIPGDGYVVVPMMRRLSDAEFTKDLAAVEGAVYLVKCKQLVFTGNEMKTTDKPEKIKDPKGTATVTSAATYPEAVIAFSAEFHLMPARTDAYFKGKAFITKFPTLKNPVFTRNLAVRR